MTESTRNWVLDYAEGVKNYKEAPEDYLICGALDVVSRKVFGKDSKKGTIITVIAQAIYMLARSYIDRQNKLRGWDYV